MSPRRKVPTVYWQAIVAHFGRASTRKGCRICVTVRLPVRPRGQTKCWQASANTPLSVTLRLLNALNSEDRGLKVRFSLATIAFDRESAQMSQMLYHRKGKNASSNPYPHYSVRLATSRYPPLNVPYTYESRTKRRKHRRQQKGFCTPS